MRFVSMKVPPWNTAVFYKKKKDLKMGIEKEDALLLADLLKKSGLDSPGLQATLDDMAAEKTVALFWSIDDVDPDFSMTQNDKIEVLRRVKRTHDADIGVNWATINEISDQVLAESGIE
jgi:hypothetical protein